MSIYAGLHWNSIFMKNIRYLSLCIFCWDREWSGSNCLSSSIYASSCRWIDWASCGISWVSYRTDRREYCSPNYGSYGRGTKGALREVYIIPFLDIGHVSYSGKCMTKVPRSLFSSRRFFLFWQETTFVYHSGTFLYEFFSVHERLVFFMISKNTRFSRRKPSLELWTKRTHNYFFIHFSCLTKTTSTTMTTMQM